LQHKIWGVEFGFQSHITVYADNIDQALEKAKKRIEERLKGNPAETNKVIYKVELLASAVDAEHELD